MITTVTLNPCIDRSIRVNDLVVGGHNRIDYSREDLGGKGINVSVVAHHMGYKTRALCFDYMDSGTFLSDMLFSLGIDASLVPVPGRLRENLKLYDSNQGQMTEINAEGTYVDQSTLSRLMQRIEHLLDQTSVLVLSGSMPPGIKKDLYKEIIELAHQKNVMVVLDAAGEALYQGILAKPDIIKPNRYEMEMLCGHPLNSRAEMLKETAALLEKGVGAVCLSLGDEGALYHTKNGVFFSKGVSLKVKGLQGAGDSLVAGLVIGTMEQKSDEETLRMAVSMAQGSLLREGTQLCTKKEYQELYKKVEVEQIL